MTAMKLGSRLIWASVGLQLAAEYDFVFLKGAIHMLESSVVSFLPLTNLSTVLISLCIPCKWRMSDGLAQIFECLPRRGIPF